MPIIKESTISRIKERLNITDVVRDYVKLKKSGRNWTGLCPFHIEKTPSFSVNEEKNLYHCFGCHASGNMISFVMRIENVPFPESIRILAQKAGIPVEYEDGAFSEQHKQHELITKVNERAAFIFHYYLTNRQEGEKARKYLGERKITAETMELFKLGYAPEGYGKLYQALLKENYTDKTILDAGLIIRSSNRDGYYDRFRNRLMFPIINAQNSVIGFGGRIMNEVESTAKYMNTPETEAYSKRNNLYGINITHNAIREIRQAIVVEGYFDAISLYQEGIRNVVALLGTALTSEQILLLKRYADEVVLLFDSDKAGHSATIRSISSLLGTDLKIRIVELPVNTDPDEYVFQSGKEGLLKLISRAPSFLKFIVLSAFKKFQSDSVDGKNRILNFIFPVITQVNDEILKSEVFRVLSNRLKVDESALKHQFSRFPATGRAYLTRSEEKKEVPDSIAEAEKFIIISMFENPQLIPRILGMVKPGHLTSSFLRRLYQFVNRYSREHGTVRTDDMLEEMKEEKMKNFIIKELVSEKYSRHLMKQLNDCLFKVRINRLEKSVKLLNERIRRLKDFQAVQKMESVVQKILMEKKRLKEEKNRLIE